MGHDDAGIYLRYNMLKLYVSNHIPKKFKIKYKLYCSPPRVLMLTGVLLRHCPLYQPAGEQCQFKKKNLHINKRKHKQNQTIAIVYLDDQPMVASEKITVLLANIFFRSLVL